MFSARVTATNPAGSTVAGLDLQVEDQAFFAFARAPGSCAAGTPVEIAYGAFDADGKPDYLDVTDLTALRQLERLPASAGQRQTWQGSYRLSFDSAGPRTILLRFVRFDRDAKERYSFIDRQCDISVTP